MANFRPLQPAPMEELAPQPRSRPLLTQKPKRTVTLGACVACRKRKSKCDGNRPTCTCCLQKDTQCVYELGPNEKPSQAMKRKNEEMQGELSNLRQLYDFLRFRPEHDALEILRKIRDESLETTPSQHIQELADLVREDQPLNSPSVRPPSESVQTLTLPPIRLALDSPNSELSSISLPSMLSLDSGPLSQRRRHASDADVSARSDIQSTMPPPTSIEALLHPASDNTFDPRLEALKNWTTVTKDSYFLSLLMTLWHKWEYSYYHYLDWELFLDDLSSGRTDFCSELLVNAVLASAGFHSSLVDNRSKPFGDSMITRFYQEARRLWDEEEDQNSLARVQAALALFMVFGKHGRDKVGYVFLQEACRIAQSLGLFQLSTSAARPHHIPIKKWDKARAVTAWALFNFQLTMSFIYCLPALLDSQPPVGIPYDDNPEPEALFRQECARSVILSECWSTLIDPRLTQPPKPEKVEILYLRLKSWFESRDECLSAARYPLPENILTAMQYHASVIRLFQPFTTYEPTAEGIRFYHDQALTRTSIAVKELRQLIFQNDHYHGWAVTITIVLHPIVVTVFGSLDEIAQQDQPPQYIVETNEAYRGLLTCLRALSIISTYNFYAQPLFRLLAQSCQGLHIPLPVEVVAMLDSYQSEAWTKNAASMVSSQYIADMRKAATGMENARMDSVVSRWDALVLTDEGKK